MDMKKSKIILLIITILVIVFLTTACETKNEKDKKYDYLVLVNKYSQLPDDWEKNEENAKQLVGTYILENYCYGDYDDYVLENLMGSAFSSKKQRYY